MVFYQDGLECVYLQSIPILVAYNKVNHYTAAKVISQEQNQSWKLEQCCLLGKSFIKSASIVNKHVVSDERSGKFAVCVDSLKHLLNLFAMEWTEGTVGDQPLGPIFHVPHLSCQPHFLSSASAKRKDTSDKSTMTSHPIPPSHSPTPFLLPIPLLTPPPPPSSSHPFKQNPTCTKKGKKSWDCEVCKKHFIRSNDLRDHKINVHKIGNPFICLICSRTYTKQRNLNQHIKNKHENTYKYTCFQTQRYGKR